MIDWSQRWLEITGWAKKQFWLKREFVHTGGSDVFRLLPITLNKDGVVDSTLLDLSDYALLPGRAGGQHLRGGTGSGDNLKLESTSHATKGSVRVLDWLMVGPDIVPVTPIRVIEDFGVANGNHELLLFTHTETGTGNAGLGLGYRADGTNRIAGYLRSTGSLPLHLQTGGQTRFVISTAGNVSLGSASPATSAKLDIQGTDGALLLPRMTTAQLNALTKTFGMVAANVTTGKIVAWDGSAWVALH